MKIYFKTIGCRVNQIETQSIVEKFIESGYSMTKRIEDADVFFINTCTVTQHADRDVISFLRKVSQKRHEAKLLVTGCFSEIFPEKVLHVAPHAMIVKNSEKEKIPFITQPTRRVSDGFFPVKGFLDRTRAFVKIQEGCNLKCSFCIVPKARPKLESKPVSLVKKEILNLLDKGFKEIVLCGIRLGMYLCPETGKNLAKLMEELFLINHDFRIRFSSLEVMEISEELLYCLKHGADKFCKHFHLPLQSGSDKVLREMNRHYNTSYYLEKILLLRETFNNVGIFTDVIVGYPTETKEDFEKTLKFVQKCKFAGLHVFSYSPRPFTQAYSLKPLASEIVYQRSKALREIDKILRNSFADSMVGSIERTLVLENNNSATRTGNKIAFKIAPDEMSGAFRWWGNANVIGLSSNFQKIIIEGNHKTNEFLNVKITRVIEGICYGISV